MSLALSEPSAHHPRDRGIDARLGIQQADRGANARAVRNDDGGNADRSRHSRGVQRARRRRTPPWRSASDHVPRSIDTRRSAFSMLDVATRWMPQAACSAGMPSGYGDLALDARLGGSGIEAERASVEPVRRDVPQHHVGIGDGRLQAAEPVADRAGLRSGTLRADGDHPLVDTRDAAAAGADLHHLDRRDIDGQATTLLEANEIDLEGGHDRRRAAVDRHPAWRSYRPCRR